MVVNYLVRAAKFRVFVFRNFKRLTMDEVIKIYEIFGLMFTKITVLATF